MSLTKMVDGVSVEMSADEEKEILAEWAKNEKLPHAPVSVDQRMAVLEAKIAALEATP
jgi:hypothetical protein